MFSRQSGPEAKRWLESNRNPSAFASNRFGTSQVALEFVVSLYAAGAKHVLIPSDSIRDHMAMEEGGPYADAIVIELDPDKDSSEVLRLYKEQATGEGYDLSAENPIIQGRWLFMWWD